MPLLARAVLAAVFGLAGIAKLAGRRQAAQSFTEFGIPNRVAGVAVSSLAIAELLCAVAILPSRTAWLGAIGIAALLTVFIAAIGVTLARGRKPQCQCFGQLRSEPIGPRILVRNGALWLAAAFVAWDAASGVGSDHASATWPALWQAVTSASAVALVAAAAVIGLAVLGAALTLVLRQYGRLLVRVERIESELGIKPEASLPGLPVGAPAPSFNLASLEGGHVSLADLQVRAKSAVLVFIEPGCGPCSDLLPDLVAAQHRSVPSGRPVRPGPPGLPGLLSTIVVLVSQGDARENREKTTGFEARNVLLQQRREVAEAYGVVGTPSAVRVTNGVVASALAVGPDAVRALLNTALDPDEAKVGPGEELPSVILRDRDGRSADLRSLAGGRTLLLFWSPSCGYCDQMLAELKRWEQTNAADPVLLVISQGSAAVNREQSLRSRVLLDDNFTVGRMLGVSGTPSAVLIENGRVVSDVQAGSHAVFALATPRPAFAGHV